MVFDILVCGFGWLIIACHSWAMTRHFTSGNKRGGTYYLTLLVLTCAISLSFFMFAGTQPLGAVLVGLALLAGSFALFWAAIKASSAAGLLGAFDVAGPSSLLQSGPYGYVRHPFYTSYIMLWWGWSIATWSIWAVVPAVATFVTYLAAARDEEQKFSRTDMADAYRAYMERTGRFFPRLFGS